MVKKEKENCKCNECNHIVNDQHKGLQCDICKGWQHMKCTRMSEEAYKMHEKEENLSWVCSKCIEEKQNMGSLNNMVKELKEEMQEMRKQMKDNREKVRGERDELKRIIDDLKEEREREKMNKADMMNALKNLIQGEMKEQNKYMLKKMESVERCLELKIEEETNKNKREIEEKIEKEMQEKMERHDKKPNLVLYGIKENEERNEEKSIEKDEVQLAKIFQTMDIKEEPTEFFRLGKSKTPGKERPMLVKMKTERACYKILKSSKLLKESTDKEINKVMIGKDLTMRQREINKKLNEELKRRRNNGETNIKIQNGKIIKIGSHQPPDDGKNA